jgi:serine/threonine protein phosphatase PrpC
MTASERSLVRRWEQWNEQSGSAGHCHQHLTRPGPSGESTEITEVFRRADTAIRVAAGDRSRGMGCTAATLLLGIDGHSTIANIGDVRVYRIFDGYLSQLTVDDRPPGSTSGVVTGCLGGNAPTAVAVHTQLLAVRPGDRLMLCSDGLHDAITLSTARLPGSWNAHRLAAELMQAALRSDEKDNVTVVIVELLAPQTPSRADTKFMPTITATPTIADTEPVPEPSSPAPTPLPERRPSVLRKLVSRIC